MKCISKSVCVDGELSVQPKIITESGKAMSVILLIEFIYDK